MNFLNDDSVVAAVKCLKCGKLHDIKESSFIVIKGDVYVGNGGGIIGCNFPKPNNYGMIPISEVRSAVYCRTMECIGEVLFIDYGDGEYSNFSEYAYKELKDKGKIE